MADIKRLVESMETDGTIARVMTDPTAQFGAPNRRYLGAELLPERNVPENAYTEDGVKYRTIIANAGSRYSPVQLKGGALVGSVKVELFDSDIGSQLNGRDYDALIRILGRNATMDAVAQLVDFLDTTVNIPLVEFNERARWQAIVDAVIVNTGDNAYAETIGVSNPAGHRAAIAAPWTVGTNDPFLDIMNRVNLLASKGYTVRRIFSSQRVVSIMGNNAMVQNRVGTVRVNVSNGQLINVSGRASLAAINAALAEDNLPPIELYDLTYASMTGTGRFLRNDVMVFVGTTTQQEQIVINPDQVELLTGTLGYVGVGRAVGQPTPGRVAVMDSFRDKPPRVTAQGWQTSAPVILEPEALAVLTGI